MLFTSWDRINIPAVPPGLAHTRPLIAYQHMPAFLHGDANSGAHTAENPGSDCPRKSIGLPLFCRDHTIRGSLKEAFDSLLTLPQRFKKL